MSPELLPSPAEPRPRIENATASAPRISMLGLRAPWGTQGGVESVVAELAPRLAALGLDVTVYCRTRYNPYPEGVRNGIHLVNRGTVYSKHLEAILHTARCLPLAWRHTDLIHLHAVGPGGLSCLSRLRGTPTVVTVHSFDWLRSKWGAVAATYLRLSASIAARFATEVIVVARYMTDYIQSRTKSRVTFIPNGVGRIEDAALEEAGLPGLQRRRFLLFVGRISPEKNLEAILNAHARSDCEWPLVIVGDTLHSSDYTARIRGLASERVKFAGEMTGQRRDALLRNAACLVLPSHVEGMPIAPLEAMKAGTPVVLSAIPAHAELIPKAATSYGWLVPRDWPTWEAAFAEIRKLGDAEIDRVGSLAAKHAEETYSWDRVAAQTRDVYLRVLSNARGQAVSAM